MDKIFLMNELRTADYGDEHKSYFSKASVMVLGYFYGYSTEIKLTDKDGNIQKTKLTYKETKELIRYLKESMKIQNEDIKERRQKGRY